MPNWLNHGVVGAIEWPKAETTFKFGSYEVLAKPPTPENEASLHIELTSHKIDYVEGMSVLSRVLSLATWVDDAYSILLLGHSGSPVPIAIPRQSRSYPSSIVDCWPNSRGPLSDPKAKRALAIYREARNTDHYDLLPYAALGNYKIAEIKYGKKVELKRWQETVITGLIHAGSDSLHHLPPELNRSTSKIVNLLEVEIRNATAHANSTPRVDPDEIGEVRRLSSTLALLRTLARTLIRDELGVSEDRWGD